jgi:hypothetical protein
MWNCNGRVWKLCVLRFGVPFLLNIKLKKLIEYPDI